MCWQDPALCLSGRHVSLQSTPSHAFPSLCTLISCAAYLHCEMLKGKDAPGEKHSSWAQKAFPVQSKHLSPFSLLLLLVLLLCSRQSKKGRRHWPLEARCKHLHLVSCKEHHAPAMLTKKALFGFKKKKNHSNMPDTALHLATLANI